MMTDLRKNPFWQREVSRGRHQAPLGDVTTSAQLGVVVFFILAFVGFHATLVLGLCLFALGLTWKVVTAVSSTYASERDSSTLELCALVPLSPAREVLGRWAGALALVFRLWLWSAAAVFFTVLLTASTSHCFYSPDPMWLLGGCALIWLFFGLWLAGVAALTLLFACVLPRKESVATSVFGFLMLMPLAALYLDPTYTLVQALPLSIGTLILLLGATFNGTHAQPGLIAWALAGWTAFVVAALALAVPLVRTRTPHLGLRPGRSAAPARVRRRAPLFCLPAWLGGDSPMYTAWLRAGRIEVPMLVAGGGVAIFTCTLLGFTFATLGERGMTAWESDALSVGVMVACLAYLVLGACFGSAALNRERQGATWPLLIVSGLRPGQVITGIFARCAHGMLWTVLVPLPLWLLLGLIAPGAALLAVLPPIVLATGILGGMASAATAKAAEPRPFVTSILIALGAVFCLPFVIFGFCLLLALVPALSPSAQMHSLLMVGGDSPLSGLGLLVAQVGLVGLLLRVFISTSRARVLELMH